MSEVAVYLYQAAHISCKSFVQVLKINATNLDDGTACLTFESLRLPSFFFFLAGVCTISFFTMNLNMDPFIQGSVLYKWRQIHIRTHLEHVYITSRSYENVFVRKNLLVVFFFFFFNVSCKVNCIWALEVVLIQVKFEFIISVWSKFTAWTFFNYLLFLFFSSFCISAFYHFSESTILEGI